MSWIMSNVPKKKMKYDLWDFSHEAEPSRLVGVKSIFKTKKKNCLTIICI